MAHCTVKVIRESSGKPVSKAKVFLSNGTWTEDYTDSNGCVDFNTGMSQGTISVNGSQKKNGNSDTFKFRGDITIYI